MPNNLSIGDGRYSVCPSAFQIIEAPLYLLHHLKERGGIAARGAATIGGMVVSPFVYCAIPLTVLTDLVVGLLESMHAKCQGYSLDQIKLILQKKWVASPYQQLHLLAWTIFWTALFGVVFNFTPPLRDLSTIINHSGVLLADIPLLRDFRIVRAVTPLLRNFGVGFKAQVFNVIFIGSALTWNFNHIGGQKDFRYHPLWAKPDGFTIFIKGGIEDSGGVKYTQRPRGYYRQQYEEYKRAREEKQQNSGNEPSPLKKRWDDFLTGSLKEMQAIQIQSELSLGMAEFKKNLENRIAPKVLLGITEDSEEALKKTYKKWTLVLHPDKNGGNSKIAEVLFKALCEATCILEEQFKNPAAWEDSD